jgi:hypothetical protein
MSGVFGGPRTVRTDLFAAIALPVLTLFVLLYTASLLAVRGRRVRREEASEDAESDASGLAHLRCRVEAAEALVEQK